MMVVVIDVMCVSVSLSVSVLALVYKSKGRQMKDDMHYVDFAENISFGRYYGVMCLP